MVARALSVQRFAWALARSLTNREVHAQNTTEITLHNSPEEAVFDG